MTVGLMGKERRRAERTTNDTNCTNLRTPVRHFFIRVICVIRGCMNSVARKGTRGFSGACAYPHRAALVPGRERLFLSASRIPCYGLQ
jgi:hypothetical protein